MNEQPSRRRPASERINRSPDRRALTRTESEPPISVLRRRLRELGPTGASFATYLSSRLDLLAAPCVRELSSLEAESREQTSADGAAPSRLCHEIFGRSLPQVFPEFDTQALEVSFGWQKHRARLHSGESVVVKIARPDAEQLAERAIGRLRGLRPLLAQLGVVQTDVVVREFAGWLRQIADLDDEATNLERLAQEADEIPFLTVPEVIREYSTPRWLTVTDLEDTVGGVSNRGPLELSTRTAEKYARRLCRIWLKLALTGPLFCEEPSWRNLLLLTDGDIGIVGGPFHSPAWGSQDHLCSYLAATTVEDHKTAWQEILALSKGPSHDARRALRHQLRHSAPFRDGNWDPSVDRLTQTVFAHWHQSGALGYLPRPTTLAFLRGLGHLDAICSRLVPDQNLLTESFQEFRLRKLLSEIVRATDRGEWAESMRRQASVLTQLPRKIDRILEEREGSDEPRAEGVAEETEPGGSLPVLSGLLGGAVAAALLAAGAGEASSWAEPLGAAVVLVLGGAALWICSRA